jgi:hypothetical protein
MLRGWSCRANSHQGISGENEGEPNALCTWRRGSLKIWRVRYDGRQATDTGIECDWCEGKKLRSKSFDPHELTTTDLAPTINVHFVKSDGDGRPESEPSAR